MPAAAVDTPVPTGPIPTGPIPTGIAGLDTILRGGLFKGGLYILEGTPGSGKTTLANQFAYNRARAGDRVVYVTLLAEGHDRMLRYMAGFDFFDARFIPDKLSYISAFDALRKEGLAGVLTVLRETIRECGAKLLFLDGLYVAQERAASKGDFREFIYEMQGEASLHGCTLMFLTGGLQTEHGAERTMVDGIIQLGQETRGSRSVRTLAVLKFRGARNLKGTHHFRIGDAGITVTPRLETLFETPPETIPDRRLASGVPSLDTMTRGGVPVGSSTLVIGPSGVGKTTLGLLFAGQATAKEPAVIFSSYETPDKIKAKATGIGIDIDAKLASKALSIVWQKPFETFPDEMATNLLAEVERTGARRVFIDGIGAFRKVAFQPDGLEAFFAALALRLRQLGVTTFYTVEAREFFVTDSLVLDEISVIAENILLLRFAETGRRLTRLLSVLKVRDSDFDGSVLPFSITDNGIVIHGAAAPVPPVPPLPPRPVRPRSVRPRNTRPTPSRPPRRKQ